MSRKRRNRPPRVDEPLPGCLDSHCHLDPEAFDGDDGVDAAVARARAAGMVAMVTIGSGYGERSAVHAVALAERHPDVWATVGLHPHDARAWSPELAAALRAHAAHPRVVALGEMGLDFHYDLSPRDDQRRALREQVRLALELGLPIVIHDRESDGETLAILDEEGAFAGAGVLYHCFGGDRDEAARIVERGGHVSISGIVTFKKADELREVARALPGDRLLVETDSPFLAPVPWRGHRNEPAHMVHTVRAVAALRGEDPEALARRTAANAARFFGLPLG